MQDIAETFNEEIMENLTILYVEDEKDVQTQIDMFLSLYVKEIIICNNGKEAIEIYKKRREDIDVIVSDISMPIMNGIDFSILVRKIDHRVPIILTTAFNDQEYFLKSIEISINKYIIKPINPEILLQSIYETSISVIEKKELDTKNVLIEVLIKNYPNDIILFSDDLKIEYVNKRFLEKIDIENKKIDELIFNEKMTIEKIQQKIEKMSKEQISIKLYKNDKEYFFIPSITYLKEIKKTFISLQDITNIELEKNEYLLDSFTDKLTGLYNRRKFELEIEDKIKNNKKFCFVILDIDHFKKINDTYGHDIGDIVLKETTKVLKSHLRTEDLFARWGGEEFVILFNLYDLEIISKIILKLKNMIEENIIFDIETNITASFGAVIFENQNSLNSLEEKKSTIIKEADRLLYDSKIQGRNTFNIKII